MGGPPPPSLVWPMRLCRERIRPYKRNRTRGVIHLKMDAAHEKLEDEVEDILKKVKQEWVVDDGVTAFDEKLKEREHLKQAAQATRTARATRLHQLCYPQHTCDWFVEGLDFCCDYWRYQFKRPDTPPPVPPPSPDVCRKRVAPPQPTSQTPRKPRKRRR